MAVLLVRFEAKITGSMFVVERSLKRKEALGLKKHEVGCRIWLLKLQRGQIVLVGK